MAAKKSKTKKETILDLPNRYRVIGADLSLKRPGFCRMEMKKTDGVVSIIDICTSSVDNKKETKKPHGQLLDESFKALTFFIPDDDVPTYFVREKAFNSRGAMSEIGIFENVGIATWFVWRLGKTWDEIYPVTVKRLITGNYKADKKQVENALFDYVGERTYANDDESDATAVAVAWLIQQKQLNPKQEEPQKSEGKSEDTK